MKFVLTYDGDLGSNKGSDEKWEIRKKMHPQLEALWKTNPSLIAIEKNRLIPRTGMFIPGTRNIDDESPIMPYEGNCIDLCEPLDMGGRKFLPLVRNTYRLKCGLKINFLRHEPPGKIYQGGDLDNRIKTLFDALTMPRYKEQVIPDESIKDPIHCLLEDDSLITSCDIETQQLWATPEGSSARYVRLTITVDVRITQSLLYNHQFMGD